MAIHKPAGMLVHRSMMDRHETRFALQLTRNAVGRKVYPVHRLDKPTSGLLLFAFSSETASQLQSQFQGGVVRKSYTALVRGWPQNKVWQVDQPLKYQVDEYSEKGSVKNKIQPAQTNFECIARTSINHPVGPFDTARYALIKVRPLTGRKHQIRRHLNHCNHPIIGDTNHGDRHHNHFFRDRFGQKRLYLAATGLQLSHPQTGEAVMLETPLQENFQSVIDQLDWD